MNTCKVEGCLSKSLAKGLCSRHWQQMKHHGKIIKTRFDSNEYMDIDDHTMAVIISHWPSFASYISTFDSEDFDLIRKHRWHFSGNGYASTFLKNQGRQTPRRMHQVLFPENKTTDHINRNSLDNRRRNLRACTQSDNMKNISIRSDNKSGTHGICFHKLRSKWQVKISINKRWTHIGLFENYDDALSARLKAEKEHYGEFAPQREMQLFV